MVTGAVAEADEGAGTEAMLGRETDEEEAGQGRGTWGLPLAHIESDRPVVALVMVEGGREVEGVGVNLSRIAKGVNHQLRYFWKCMS